ncbi:HNH endonuclease signature motif containing protein [Gordonia shandongensis]|uniref:HNH endonuclease signature motif containing protein n=1 Tax=Gordonia shandongensis TaxID=376351 RepID=UPI00041C4A70|nr:HNH endonuclease signature motif containing protein [Gordonia shandongensis]
MSTTPAAPSFADNDPTGDPAVAPAITLPDDPVALARLLVDATEALRTADLDALTEDQLITVAETVEQARRKGDATDAALITAVSDRAAYRNAGWIRLSQFLGFGLRLSPGEVKRRTLAASKIGRLSNLQGEVLDPVLPATATAVAHGAASTAHVLVIAETVRLIPDRVPADTVSRAEADLADAARTLAPDQLKKVGMRLLAHLDPDGRLTDERDRQRHRELVLARQDLRLMSKLTAHLTPQVRAKLDVVLQAWAAPGFNDPDDPDSLRGAADAPGVDPAAREAAAERDQRSPGQRNHDALEALLDFALSHKALGAPGKLSSSLVITADLSDLAARVGIALTATGTRLPVGALVDIAADAVPYLEVFADATREVLYFGRGRRLAGKAQRLALFGRDRGCTAPGCDRPFSMTEAHHMPDWQYGGSTDIDHLGAACGGHNRAASTGPARWDTEVLGSDAGPNAGRVGWKPAKRDIPPAVNPIHHADLPLRRPPPAAHPPSPRASAAEYVVLDLLASHPATPTGDTDLRFPPAA